MNIEELKLNIRAAVSAFNLAFYEKHKERIDFGCCGSAVTLISFGRKRKIKELFEEAGLLGMDWCSAGRKSFVIEYDGNAGISVRTQYIGYYEGRARIVTDLVREWLKENKIELDVYTHTWID